MPGSLRACSLGLAMALGLLATTARSEILIGVAAPLTGSYAWSGTHTTEGVGMAVRDLNAAGGVLGEPVEALVVDDFCDPEQALAAAAKLIAAEVPVVVGHQCSGAALPASEKYEEAGVILITPGATNPRVTERGLRTIFRTVGRDDEQGALAAKLLADRHAGDSVAVVHDGQAYGEGVAREVIRSLDVRGIDPILVKEIEPTSTDFTGLIDQLESAEADIVFYGGYQHEAGLIVRQAKDRLEGIEFVMPDGIMGEDFPLVAGPAAEGTLMSGVAEARDRPTSAEVVERFRAEGFEPVAATLYAYAAVQAWAQAVEQVGTTRPEAVIPVLRNSQFDTVLGRLGFDEKGDVTGIDTFDWYVWESDGYVPLEPPELTD